jgi:hypothetical protein
MSDWNWLEIAKLLVSAITPLVVIGIGFWLNRKLKSLEQSQWANQKIIEKRISIYDEMAPKLNDVLVYFCYIGRWRQITPPDMIGLKRELDSKFYISAPLFSARFGEVYNQFIAVCYVTYMGWGHGAQLRINKQFRKVVGELKGSEWNSEWDKYFAPDEFASNPDLVTHFYKEIMSVFVAELGLELKPMDIPAGHAPSNIEGLVAAVQQSDNVREAQSITDRPN